MKISCGIYSITNIINGKKIIGQSCRIESRMLQHKWELRNNKHENEYLQNAWNKYGEQNFRFEILLECSKEMLDQEEIRTIKEYKTTNRDLGYNIKEGGHSPRMTDETKEKISKSNIGNLHCLGRKLSNETKEKMRRAAVGRKLSNETKEKISKSKLGFSHPQSIETREKIRIAKIGSKFSDEHKKHMSEAISGEKHWNFGGSLSEEIKNKIRESNLGQSRSEETKQKMKDAWKKRKEEAMITKEE